MWKLNLKLRLLVRSAIIRLPISGLNKREALMNRKPDSLNAQNVITPGESTRNDFSQGDAGQDRKK